MILSRPPLLSENTFGARNQDVAEQYVYPTVFRPVIVGLLVGFVFFSACTSADTEPTAVVTVCLTADAPENCTNDQAEFLVGQSLSARLATSDTFATGQVIGRILRLTDTDTLPLGSQMIPVEPNQRAIVQSLPFHEFGPQAAGDFLIEFMDERNQLIAKKKITITAP